MKVNRFLFLFFAFGLISLSFSLSENEKNFQTEKSDKWIDENPIANRVVTTVRSAVNRAVQEVAHRWADLEGKWKHTISEIFGDKPFWDRTYQFEIPAKFKTWTLERFFKINGATPTFANENSFLEIQTENKEKVAVPDSYFFLDQYPECRVEEINQGQCGSCYAFSIAGVLTHRTCRALRSLGLPPLGDSMGDRLSAQPIISCVSSDVSPNGDGCAGGNVFKAYTNLGAKQYGSLSTYSCQNYYSFSGFSAPGACASFKNGCENPANPVWGNKIVAGNPRKLIGEDAIKQAIFTEGPISVTMRTPSNFIGASGIGVFSRGGAPWLTAGTANAYHAVVLHGWGKTSDGIKYWIIENSWGDIYAGGENGCGPHANRGFIKVLRGADDMNIETLVQSHATPMLVLSDGSLAPITKSNWISGAAAPAGGNPNGSLLHLQGDLEKLESDVQEFESLKKQQN